MRRKEENRGRKHLSIAFALCLVISIVALPAFAGQFGEESQEDVVSFESDEPIVLSEDLMSGFEEDTTGEEGVTEEGLPEESAPDWVQPEDGVTVTRPETEQSEEKPGLPEQVVTAVTDEFAFMKMNSTGDDIDLQSDEPEEKSYPLNKPYDQLRLSGYKKWVGDFAKTSVPDSVTLQLRGYLDVNDNGTLDDEDRAYFASVAKGVNKAELPARVKKSRRRYPAMSMITTATGRWTQKTPITTPTPMARLMEERMTMTIPLEKDIPLMPSMLPTFLTK